MQERGSFQSVVAYEELLVIVGGGTVDMDLLRDLYVTGAHVIGADGGADTIVAAGLMPEAIIGDLDSLENAEGWLGRTRLMRISEQDTTDFEKALYSTSAPVTVALGMTGKRFDHTLAALDTLARRARDRIVVLVDDGDLALAVTGPFEFEVDVGERVSIHPLVPIKFRRSYGLKYPLDGLSLAPGERTGTSNKAVDGLFSVEPELRTKIPWLLVIDRKYLFRIIAATLKREE